MEPFGAAEKPWSEEEKLKIREFLKYDHHVPLKVAEMVYSAETESEYFSRAGKVLAAIAVPAFYVFPIVRQQPVYRRAALALLPGYFFYSWGENIRNDLLWGKTIAAYRRFVIYHGQHPKLFV